MTDHKAVKEYLTKAIEVLKKNHPIQANIEYFEKVIGYIDNAETLVDNEEKQAHLNDAVMRWANQITFLLFRHDNLPEEMIKEFRSFGSVEEADEVVASYGNVRQEKIDKNNAERKVIDEEMQKIELLNAVIGGLSLEEANKKQAEYYDNVKTAEAQLARQ